MAAKKFEERNRWFLSSTVINLFAGLYSEYKS